MADDDQRVRAAKPDEYSNFVDPAKDTRRLSSGFAITYGIITALASVAPWLWAIPILLMVGGFSMAVSNTSANSLLQATVPARLRGRTISLYMLAMRGGLSVGSLLAGVSANLLGVRYALLINGVLAVVTHFIVGRRWSRGSLPLAAPALTSR